MIELAKKLKLCGRLFEKENWWGYCGETDMGQTYPVMCTECYERLKKEGYELSMHGKPYKLRAG